MHFDFINLGLCKNHFSVVSAQSQNGDGMRSVNTGISFLSKNNFQACSYFSNVIYLIRKKKLLRFINNTESLCLYGIIIYQYIIISIFLNI